MSNIFKRNIKFIILLFILFVVIIEIFDIGFYYKSSLSYSIDVVYAGVGGSGGGVGGSGGGGSEGGSAGCGNAVGEADNDA
ncbi:MAG TPA: hypothetical protein ENI63_00005, partial [Candidatus Kaiserbacteria bacterium]|nr:hypothetical protein [Candidatus Kaiserbacteria bacterium]